MKKVFSCLIIFGSSSDLISLKVFDMSLHIYPAQLDKKTFASLSRNFKRLVGLLPFVLRTFVLFSPFFYDNDMRIPLCLKYSMMFCILLSSAKPPISNIDLFVDVILDIRKFYSVTTVMFAHPGDDYKNGGQFKAIYVIINVSSKYLFN